MDSKVKNILDEALKNLDSVSKANSASLEAYQKLHPKTLPKKIRFGKTLINKGYMANVSLSVGGALIVVFDNPADGELFFNGLK